MSKPLSLTPRIGLNSVLVDSELGVYTEVGPDNRLENVVLDDYAYTGERCILQNARIGKFANIAAEVRIGPTDHPYTRATLHHFTYRSSLFAMGEDDAAFFADRSKRLAVIKEDTWIGHAAIIMPEVTVGVGAIVGSGSIVTKDVDDYAIVVGNPARVIKYRFEPEIIAALLRIRWWNWSYDQLRERMADFRGDIRHFIAKYDQEYHHGID